MAFPEAFKNKMIAAKKKAAAPTDASASVDPAAKKKAPFPPDASASYAPTEEDMSATGASGDEATSTGMSEDEDASSDVPPELAKGGKVNPLKRWAFNKGSAPAKK